MSLQLTTIPTEQSTAITNIIITCAATVYLIGIRYMGYNYPTKSSIWMSIYFLMAMGAGLGAILHGVMLPPFTFFWLLGWIILLFLLSLTVSLFGIAVVYDWYGKKEAFQSTFIFIPLGILFYIVALIIQNFVAIALYEGILMIFAFLIYFWLGKQQKLQGAYWMSAGFFFMMIGVIVQMARFKIQVIWLFDQNGVYHLVSLIGITLLFIGLFISFKAHPIKFRKT